MSKKSPSKTLDTAIALIKMFTAPTKTINEENIQQPRRHCEVLEERGNPTGTLPRAAILWRDLFFLVVGCIALRIIWTVESTSIYNENDNSVERASTAVCAPPRQRIIDSGFILTSSLHDFLANNREWNDFFAALNSIFLAIPFAYVIKVTLWYGDYSLGKYSMLRGNFHDGTIYFY